MTEKSGRSAEEIRDQIIRGSYKRILEEMKARKTSDRLVGLVVSEEPIFMEALRSMNKVPPTAEDRFMMGVLKAKPLHVGFADMEAAAHLLNLVSPSVAKALLELDAAVKYPVVVMAAGGVSLFGVDDVDDSQESKEAEEAQKESRNHDRNLN